MVVAYPVARNAARLPARNVAGIGDTAASLSLDFTLGYLSPLITFTRASSATYFNSTGLLATASTDVPRFGYNPSTLAPRGLLIEQTATNLALYSEQFDNAAWTVSGTTVAADNTTAPDGNVTADKLKEDGTTAHHYITNTTGISVTSGTTYTFSAFIKAAERTFAFLVLASPEFATTAISVNLTTGAVSTATGTPLNAFTQTLPNGWFRVGFSLAATATSATAQQISIRCSTDGVWANRSYTGTTGSGIYIWGAQLEAAGAPTSYIATTSASATRLIDLPDITTLTPWYNTTEGTIVVTTQRDYVSSSGTNPCAFSLNDGTSSNRVFASISTSPGIRLSIVNGGVTQAQIDINGNATGTNKLAAAYKLNNSNFALNGTLGTLDTACTIPTITQLSIGKDRSSVNPWGGWIQSLRYYPVRLPDTTLQALTA